MAAPGPRRRLAHILRIRFRNRHPGLEPVTRARSVPETRSNGSKAAPSRSNLLSDGRRHWNLACRNSVPAKAWTVSMSRLQVFDEQFGKSVSSQSSPHESLVDVEIGVAIAFDDVRAIVENGNVPANHDAVGKC